ncbi:RNase adapter RapZ, partial [Desulfosarcina sp. OttesenSCG-928-G17]|nr:RNase adapter RapZ [Desulfosarcina sp. OttesenSCG-928-G17]
MVKEVPIVVITGLSGAGKKTALSVFEDEGYYCVDNMPVSLLPAFFALPMNQQDETGIGFAFSMDARETGFVCDYKPILRDLRKSGAVVCILFLEADEKTLIRRYSQTRRKHPFAGNRDIRKAIGEELKVLLPLREKADTIIDTSSLNVHELKMMVRKMAYSMGGPHRPMRIQLVSFGFKFGLPLYADIVIDVRFLQNPYFIEELRPLTGKSEKIRDFVLNSDQTHLFLTRYMDLLNILMPQYEQEGKAYLTLAVGCTGGRHRSVVIAQEICDAMVASGRKVELIHRDIDKLLS